MSSLEDIKSQSDAQKVLDEVKPDYVIWSAGAGGKGGQARTFAIDRDAATYFIRSAISTPTITKFLMVSALSERRERAPWWDEESWALVQKMNTTALANYYKAKLVADDWLTVLGEKRIKEGDDKFQYIDLRPGGLNNEPASGKVELGKSRAKGWVSRADVADVGVRLLERDDTRGWFDLLGGEEPIEEAVERVVREKINSMEGEDIEKMTT